MWWDFFTGTSFFILAVARPHGYGLTESRKRELDSRYEAESEQQAIDWINAVLGTSLVSGGPKVVQVYILFIWIDKNMCY